MESYMIHGLSFTYPDRAKPALSNVSLKVRQGQFITVFGPTGGGKTTLLRQLKPILAPHGIKSGEILFCGEPIENIGHRIQSEKIGFVLQSIENQLVTDKVWHELAFGLESLGYSTAEIRLRVAEMAAFFGIEPWFYKNVSELSGGQKQLLNLASVMAMQPSVLILDEPTSQLDPIAASDFLSTVSKINRELGITVIMTEHRLEKVFPLSDRAVCLDEGRVICDDEPRRVGEALRGLGHGMFLAAPSPMRIWASAGDGRQLADCSECPVTVRDGRVWLDKLVESSSDIRLRLENPELSNKGSGFSVAGASCEETDADKQVFAIEISDVWFRYEKQSPDVIRRLSLSVKKGEFLCVVGGNGAGKTTALMLVAGLYKPQRGKIKLFGEDICKIPPARLFSDGAEGGVIGILPQNTQTLFVKKTVREDLLEIFSGRKVSREDKEKRLLQVTRLCRIETVLNSHPYDLSGGEQQRAALAKIMLLCPQILLLDEPTKGLDAAFKQELAAILKNLAADGVAIVLVSHDIEFCAEHGGDRCAMFFDGSVVTDAPKREFFSGNSFYTTAANRMARHRLPLAITANDVINALGGGKPEPTDSSETGIWDTGPVDNLKTEIRDPKPTATPETGILNSKVSHPLPLWRKLTAAVAALVLTGIIITIIVNFPGFLSFISGGSEAQRAVQDSEVWRYAAMLIILCISAFVLAVAGQVRQGTVLCLTGQGAGQGTAPFPKRLSKRTLIAAVMILVAIPLTIFVGVRFLGDRRYYFISMLIILETIFPFVLIFEGRKPQAREIVVIAVLCALGVAGRTAFFMLPHVKPIAALAIITGVAFGGEAGFLFGAITGFLSNMFFGQGAWTPWQMFAYGIIGFLAGVLFRKGLLARSRTALCVYGGFAVFVIYGVIMNSSAVLMYQADSSLKMFLIYMVQGIPLDLIHASSTVMFLGILAHPMLEKLDRIKTKYGMLR